MAIPSSSYPERKQLRMPGYDYAEAGAYFITAVTQSPVALFGHICDGEMQLSRLGAIARDCWIDLPNHYAHLALDEFVVMPNHVHGVMWLRDAGRAGLKPAPYERRRETARFVRDSASV